VRILNILDQRTASPSELADELELPLGNVSYHVRMLARLGMVRLVARKQRRGATEHFYRAETRPVITDEGWAQLPEIVKSAMIGANLVTTGEYVQSAAEHGGFSRADAHLSRTTFECDEQAWGELTKLLADTFASARKIADRSAERVARDPHAPKADATTVLMLFEGGEPRDVHSHDRPLRHAKRRSARRPSAAER
jgi:DNA-binding transcriptional ArsR family regulator